MKVQFTTLGCKLNFAESSALGKELLRRGHSRVGRGERADICVINTCSVTDMADHKDRQLIHRIRRQNPDAVLVVTGCYAQLKPQEVADISGVDYVLGMEEKFHIPELVERIEQQASRKTDAAIVETSPIREQDSFHSASSSDDRTRCFLKIQDGCNYFCTYCTIPLARGKSRNASISEVVAQATAAIAGGAKEIVLTGVNIGDFGRTTGERFEDLLRALDDISGEFRIRISSCEPNLLTDRIIDFVSTSRHFAPHFHIPLQSGSNEVLRIMHRRYTRELFAERVAHIREVLPHAFIGVDCMVGVRGETQEYWEDYLSFIRSLDVSQLHVFTYSERAHTRMLEMALEVVPASERKRRSEVLHEVSEAKLSAFYAREHGNEGTVLWESKQSDGKMSGFTENYIQVSRPYDRGRVNTFEKIIIGQEYA